MSPHPPPANGGLLSHLDGLIGGAVAALAAVLAALGLRRQRGRELDAKSTDLESQAEERRTGTWLKSLEHVQREADGLRERCDKLVAERDTLRERNEDLQRDVDAAQDDRARLMLTLLDVALPPALWESPATGAGPPRRGADLVLNALTDPFVVTARLREGSFLFANEAFCKAVAMPRERILLTSWRAMVVREQLMQTHAVEREALEKPVVIANTFRRGDGGQVDFEWTAASYNGGVTIAVARLAAPPAGV